MLCPNCGNSIPDESKFCTTCGARVQGEEPVQPEVNAEPVAPGFSAPEQEPAPRKKFNFKPLIIIAAVVVGIIVAGAVAVMASPVAKNLFMKTVLSPEDYLSYVLENSAGSLATDLHKNLTVVKSMSSVSSTAATGSVKVSKGDGLDKLMQEVDPYSYGEVKPYLDAFKSVGSDVEITVDGVDMAGKATVKLNDKDIASIDIVTDLENGRFYYGVPEISSTYLMAENPGLSYSYDEEYAEVMSNLSENMDAFIDAFPDEKTTKKLFSAYAKTAAEQVDNVTESSNTYMAGAVSQKVTELSVSVSEHTLYNIATEVVDKASKDEDLKKIIEDFGGLEILGGDAVAAYNAFLSGVGDAQNSLYSVDQSEISYSQLCNLTILVDNKGEICGFVADADGGKIEFYTLADGDNFGTVFGIIPDSGESFKLVGNGVNGGDKTTATYTFKVADAGILEIVVDNMDNKLAEQGIFNGTVTVSAGKDVAGLVGMLGSEASMIKDLKITLTSNAQTATDADAKVALYYKDAMVVEVGVTAKEIDAKPITIPTNYVDIMDYDASQEWAKTADFTKVIGNLRAAGFPEEILTELETNLSLMQSMPEDDEL